MRRLVRQACRYGGERVAAEQTVVGVTDRPQPARANLGVRVRDVVAVPGARLGLVIEEHLAVVERSLVSVLVGEPAQQ